MPAASFADQCDVVALLLAKGATSSIANLKGLSARQEAKSRAQEVYYVFEKYVSSTQSLLIYSFRA